jgi:two-component system response regulator PilR (NtrC family)
LRNLVNTALRLCDGRVQPQRRLLGDSPAMRRTRATIQKLARSQAPVYISGESGTGKELAARLIHEQGPRAEGNFVPVNCGAIPAELMESELFGHKKGSFTGAVADKSGLFQTADRGTLFLDEVGELPLPMQVKLLRAIQEKSVRPVGAQQEVAVDVRILSATHQDLGALVSEGRFRQDLFYRINVIELRVPPLRERPEDIPLLTEHILVRLANHTGSSVPRISPQALAALQRYDYPGNVRELENILERALTLSEGQVVELDTLVFPTPLPEVAPELPTEAAPAEAAPSEPAEASPAGLDTWLGSVERARIINALESTRWNKTAAARLLGISFGALRYRMQKLGLD